LILRNSHIGFGSVWTSTLFAVIKRGQKGGAGWNFRRSR
jgi:hypothetical protein